MTLWQFARFLHFTGILFWMSGIYMWLEAVRQIRGGMLNGTEEQIRQEAYRAFRFGIGPGVPLALSGGILMISLNPSLLAQRWLHLKFMFLAGLLIFSASAWQRTRRGTIISMRWSEFTLHVIVGGLLGGILWLATFRPAFL